MKGPLCTLVPSMGIKRPSRYIAAELMTRPLSNIYPVPQTRCLCYRRKGQERDSEAQLRMAKDRGMGERARARPSGAPTLEEAAEGRARQQS